METKKGIIIYRGNELLDSAIPIIRTSLQEKGYGVEVQRFTPEVREKQIEEWYKNESDRFNDFIFQLNDETFYRSTGESANYFNIAQLMQVNLNDPKEKVKLSLDQILECVTFISLFGKEKWDMHRGEQPDYNNLEEGLKETEEAYIKTLSKIKKLPEIVYIETNNLSDHPPFNSLRKNKDIDYDTKADIKSAEILAEWFKNVGIKKTILIRPGRDPDEEGKIEGSWLIHDRHYKTRGEQGQTVLAVPFANFWRDINNQRLIDENSISIEKTLREYISERFI